MPQVAISVTCVCGAVKGETNHWWYIVRQNLPIAMVIISLRDDEIARAAKMGNSYPNTIVCGEACAAKELSKWMQQQKEQAKNA